MLSGKASPGIWSRVAALLLSPALLISTAVAGNPVTLQLYSGLSNPIFVNAGTVTINFSYFLMYGGRGNPVNDDPQGTGGQFACLATIPETCWLRYGYSLTLRSGTKDPGG
jgi:hypothetical protein